MDVEVLRKDLLLSVILINVLSNQFSMHDTLLLTLIAMLVVDLQTLMLLPNTDCVRSYQHSHSFHPSTFDSHFFASMNIILAIIFKMF